METISKTQDLVGRIILKWMLEKCDRGYGMIGFG